MWLITARSPRSCCRFALSERAPRGGGLDRGGLDRGLVAARRPPLAEALEGGVQHPARRQLRRRRPSSRHSRHSRVPAPPRIRSFTCCWRSTPARSIRPAGSRRSCSCCRRRLPAAAVPGRDLAHRGRPGVRLSCGSPVGVTMIVIAQLRAQRMALQVETELAQELALQDSLTGLGNRRAADGGPGSAPGRCHRGPATRPRDVRPGRVQGLQRHLRARDRGRAAETARGQARGHHGGPGPELPDGRRRVLRAGDSGCTRGSRDR